jgi:hypothetical protein
MQGRLHDHSLLAIKEVAWLTNHEPLLIARSFPKKGSLNSGRHCTSGWPS